MSCMLPSSGPLQTNVAAFPVASTSSYRQSIASGVSLKMVKVPDFGTDPEPRCGYRYAGHADDDALTNKVKNYVASNALYFMFYNFGRIHQTLRVTPAMEAGIMDHV